VRLAAMRLAALRMRRLLLHVRLHLRGTLLHLLRALLLHLL